MKIQRWSITGRWSSRSNGPGLDPISTLCCITICGRHTAILLLAVMLTVSIFKASKYLTHHQNKLSPGELWYFGEN